MVVLVLVGVGKYGGWGCGFFCEFVGGLMD